MALSSTGPAKYKFKHPLAKGIILRGLSGIGGRNISRAAQRAQLLQADIELHELYRQIQDDGAKARSVAHVKKMTMELKGLKGLFAEEED